MGANAVGMSIPPPATIFLYGGWGYNAARGRISRITIIFTQNTSAKIILVDQKCEIIFGTIPLLDFSLLLLIELLLFQLSLLNALAKSNNNLFAIASKSEK